MIYNKLKKYGKDVRIHELALITRPELVEMGSHIAIDMWTYISTNLIIYKKALYNSEFVPENILITQLNPLINSKSIWKSHALHLLGEYFYYKKEKKKSKEFFEQIIKLENANPEIKNEAKKRILRDFSE